MPFPLRCIDTQRPFISHFSWDIFAKTIPMTTIDAALTATDAHEQRCRRLSMRSIVVLVIAMSLWTDCAIPMVFRHMVRGLRWLWPVDECLPQRNALTYRRYQRGARPLAWLFHACCRLVATTDTPGAFLFGLRLMAIDGTVANLPDTPENARHFGRPQNAQGGGAPSQAQIVYLVECGTHAIVDAGIWPYVTHERVGSRRMLRSVGPGMLVLWDRGLHSRDDGARSGCAGPPLDIHQSHGHQNVAGWDAVSGYSPAAGRTASAQTAPGAAPHLLPRIRARHGRSDRRAYAGDDPA